MCGDGEGGKGGVGGGSVRVDEVEGGVIDPFDF